MSQLKIWLVDKRTEESWALQKKTKTNCAGKDQ